MRPGSAAAAAPPRTAVVFAYHNVGCRCLSVLLAHGVRVPLVVTHADAPDESIWFGSVADLAASYGIPIITPADPNEPRWLEMAGRFQPDFIFSFYYRHMLNASWLSLPVRGALNMHGSLLPRYRGRAPVNWAVLRGETETGATLHDMVVKPDAGDVVAQQQVPILPNDTAREVFDKVTVAAEIALDRALPLLMADRAERRPQNLSEGSYFGGRRPADGLIHWSTSPYDVHNLVRAVAPPYPGAFTSIDRRRVELWSTRIVDDTGTASRPALFTRDGRCFAQCENGRLLQVLAMRMDGQRYEPQDFASMGTRMLGYFDSPSVTASLI